jgi:Ca2+-transporting ATPase
MVGRIWNIGDNDLLCVKGANENVLPLCNLSSEKMDTIEGKIVELSKRGYRVLVVAKQEVDVEVCQNITDHNLVFLGLIALIDPLREGVAASIQECYRAGIRVIMITGDNGETAKGIARQINLKYSDNVITGIELEAMSDKELEEKVKTADIFARVYPTHKMRIVTALQNNGDIVAMTGDGVNDAPALKKAEVGIAISKKSTSVAKEAADMILLDNDFEIIVGAIKNGRRIYSNIKKAILYIFVVHIPIALISLFVPMLDYPILLLPVHVVLLELIIDPMSSIVFERLKADKDIMLQKPRKVSEALVNLNMIIKSIIQGAVASLIIIGSYIYLLNTNVDKSYAATFAIVILLLFNVLSVYMNQSDDYMIVNFVRNFKDKIIVFISLVILIGLLLIVYLPVLNNILNTRSLALTDFLIAFGLSILGVCWFDIVKLFKRLKNI